MSKLNPFAPGLVPLPIPLPETGLRQQIIYVAIWLVFGLWIRLVGPLVSFYLGVATATGPWIDSSWVVNEVVYGTLVFTLAGVYGLMTLAIWPFSKDHYRPEEHMHLIIYIFISMLCWVAGQIFVKLFPIPFLE